MLPQSTVTDPGVRHWQWRRVSLCTCSLRHLLFRPCYLSTPSCSLPGSRLFDRMITLPASRPVWAVLLHLVSSTDRLELTEWRRRKARQAPASCQKARTASSEEQRGTTRSWPTGTSVLSAAIPMDGRRVASLVPRLKLPSRADVDEFDWDEVQHAETLAC